MGETQALETGGEVRRADPQVRRIGVPDVAEAFAEGVRDFQGATAYGLFFGGLYALAGLGIVLSITTLGLPWLAYPLAAGFVLIGPFVAVGLYEVSRRREAGETLDWPGVLGVVFSQGKRELSWMAFVTLFIMIMWLYQVRLLLALFLGFQSFSTFPDFLRVVATTPEGLMFFAVGNVVGAVLATILFSLTVVSFPLLLDREVDFITAMITSVRAVALNPGPMLVFAASIAALCFVAMLPAFLGLVVVLPILGHTTWRLYRRVVAPAA